MVECGCKIEEEVKAMQSEIKGNVPRVTGRKPGLQSTIWRRNKETRIQKKNEERLRNL